MILASEVMPGERLVLSYVRPTEAELVPGCGLGDGGGFDFCEHFLQVFAGEIAATEDDGGDFLRIGDIVERIRFQEDEIGNFARFDRAEPILQTEEAGGIESCGLQSFERSKSSGDESLQFFVQAESGEDVDAWRSVRSSEKRNALRVQKVNDIEFFL